MSLFTEVGIMVNTIVCKDWIWWPQQSLHCSMKCTPPSPTHRPPHFFLLLFMSQLETIITKLGTKSTELLRKFVCRDSFESTGFYGNQHVSALVLSHLASSWPSHLVLWSGMCREMTGQVSFQGGGGVAGRWGSYIVHCVCWSGISRLWPWPLPVKWWVTCLLCP